MFWVVRNSVEFLHVPPGIKQEKESVSIVSSALTLSSPANLLISLNTATHKVTKLSMSEQQVIKLERNQRIVCTYS